MPASLIRTIVLAAALLSSGNAALAQPTSPPAWEQLTPMQREQLMGPLRERWNGASAEERSRMLDHAQRWQSMSPAERAEARLGMHSWKHLPPLQREEARALYSALRNLAPAEREELRERWKQMTPEQRQRWATENPAPPRPAPHRP